MENEIKTYEEWQKLVAIERTFNSSVSAKTQHNRTQNKAVRKHEGSGL